MVATQMRRGICLSLLLCTLAVSVELDLSNWMGQLEPVIGDATMLDLSVPGSHDSMTADLSTDISEGYEGLGPVISKILHSVTPLVAGKFIREQGQSQGLDLVAQLNSGVRFVDFRIMYTDAPSTILPDKDWYNLHGCQSNKPALDYLKKVRTWLDAHPKEILVFWASRHGDTCLNGTAAYPETTPQQRQAFFQSVKSLFGSLLHNSTLSPLNETSISTLWKRGTQVIWYAADFVESTASSPLALNSCKIDNQLPGQGYGYGSLNLFRSGKSHRDATKAADKFFLMSLAGSDSCTIEHRALLTYVPFIEKAHETEECAKCYGIKGMTTCLMSLQESGQLNNYYNQIVLDGVFQEGDTKDSVDFPNAIYIDGIDVDGQIRTGTQRLNPSSTPLAAAADPQTAGFGYASTVIAASIRRLCRGSSKPECSTLMAAAAAARSKHPVQTWDDAANGRMAKPPPLPHDMSSAFV